MGVIIYNGVPSDYYGIKVEHPPNYEMPEKDYETIHIPGRNGDIIIDKGSYLNVNREYQISIGCEKESFTELSNRIIDWLHIGYGYLRLEDSYDREHYRLAACVSSVDFTNILNHGCRTTIVFNCKPQRFIKYGDDPIKFVTNGKIVNSTMFTALPIITVYGSGDGIISVGKCTVALKGISNYLTINSEIQDCYKGTENMNASVTLSSGFYPELVPGDNSISFSGGITSVEVIPKWWIL